MIFNLRRKAWADGYYNHLAIFCPSVCLSVHLVWYGIAVCTGGFFTDHIVDSEPQPITIAISMARLENLQLLYSE